MARKALRENKPVVCPKCGRSFNRELVAGEAPDPRGWCRFCALGIPVGDQGKG